MESLCYPAGWGRIFTIGLPIKGFAFSTDFPTELLEWGHKLNCRDFGGKKVLATGILNGRIRGKKQKNVVTETTEAEYLRDSKCTRMFFL